MLFSAKSTLLVLAKMCYLTGLLFKKTKKSLNMNSLPAMEAPSPRESPVEVGIWPSENKGPKSEPEMAK